MLPDMLKHCYKNFYSNKGLEEKQPEHNCIGRERQETPLLEQSLWTSFKMKRNN